MRRVEEDADMNKCIALCMATAISLGSASAASAETWSPTGTITLSGGLILVKGLTIACSTTATLTLNGSSATVSNITLVGPNCGAIGFVSQPYNLEPSSTSSVTLEDVEVSGITGNCAGDLTASFNQSTGTITFSGSSISSIPSVPAGGVPCFVAGILNSSPQASYTFP